MKGKIIIIILFLCSSCSTKLYVRDINSGQKIWQNTINSSVSTFAKLKNNTVAIALADGLIKILDIKNGSTLDSYVIRPKGSRPKLLSMDSNGNMLAVGTTDGRVFLRKLM